MADDTLSFQGPDRDTLLAIAKKAVGLLCSIDPDSVKVDEDGDILCTGDSSGLFVGIGQDPPALIFRGAILRDIEESPALYALLNEINNDLSLGQIYYNMQHKDVRYYYQYFAENPSPELVSYIISEMIDIADLYDDRLKTRLGGERFIEVDEDEVEV
ncbi:YbjN domain-containing protein [Synechococcus sp. CBW1006]|uniref:T3SS (YopN, CesT) and YbjN peptide-binding chaperone 1 n=1 Tax=Synechococcus sp. CBW1006 TaxID=1353138 RepID=UPI0018CF2B9E|nr:YbjN domain-containing protein [Synechococcus sp. CBW1006]QPN66564.1 YbjN domain-containing protein [Synechococcus sp. CBW1006]